MQSVLVLDELVPAEQLSAVQKYFEKSVRWNFGWPQGERDPFSHWTMDFLEAPVRNQEDLEGKLLGNPEFCALADVWRSLKAGPFKGHHLIRCYANAHTFGIEGFPHTDTMDSTQINNYTAVVYINPVWKKEWAGELVLFDNDGDTIFAVLPKPGRTAIFPGEMRHAARAVSRICPAIRVSLAFKTRIPENLK
jgi:hypothetical protein